MLLISEIAYSFNIFVANQITFFLNEQDSVKKRKKRSIFMKIRKNVIHLLIFDVKTEEKKLGESIHDIKKEHFINRR